MKKFFSAVITMIAAALFTLSCSDGTSTFQVPGSSCWYVKCKSDTPGKFWYGVKTSQDAVQTIISADKDSIRYLKDYKIFITHKAQAVNVFDTAGTNLGNNTFDFYAVKDGYLTFNNPLGTYLLFGTSHQLAGPYQDIVDGPAELFVIKDGLCGVANKNKLLIPEQYETFIVVSQNMPETYYYLGKIKNSKKKEWDLFNKDGTKVRTLTERQVTALEKEAKRLFSKQKWEKGIFKGIKVPKVPLK